VDSREGEPGETLSIASADRPGEPVQAPAAPVDDVAPGDCIGRYTVRRLIGAGGMGRVFAAYDPQLGRDVALKLIRPDRGRNAARARTRLLREARALARLHHPNVVTVHDAGARGDRIFIAMELVPGVTLTDWLAAAPRTWREILASFLAAGRGLVATHALGIVHRDFKPDNVIVGNDRIVVVDFGLARAAGGDGVADEPDPGGPAEPSLTLTGERVGTPLYMAPEQRAGAVAASADQFSFCVALWAALHGEHPGAGDPVPRRTEVPVRINAAVLRGLARDPEARWPSLAALLAELARDPRAARRRVVLGAAMIALAAASIWGMVGRGAGDPCAGADARLAGAWDPARKAAVRGAFAATGLPFGDATWRSVETRLDDYAARWADGYRDTCRATRVEGRQSDTLMDLRMACLERRRAVLVELTGVWAAGVDGETLGAAVDAARDLPPLAECSDARALAERIAPAPAQAAGVAAARSRVDAVQALTLAHRWQTAREQARTARAAADAIGWPGVRAEAAFAEGDVLSDLSDPAAEAPLLDAARLAGVAHDDLLAARALTGLVKSLAVDAQSAPRALLAADIAEGAIARAGDDRGLRALLLRNRAEALFTAARYDAAYAAFSEARAVATAAFGAGDAATLWATTELARVASARGDFAGARALAEANLAATIRALGPDHPSVASTLNNLALVVEDTGDYAAAAGYLRRALAIKEKVGGSEAVWTAMTMNNLGIAEMFSGHVAEADALHERALAIRTRALGPDHPHVAMSLGNLASVRRIQRRYDEALELLRRALAIETRSYGETHVTVATHLAWTGDVLDSRGDIAGALDYYRRALAVRKQALGAAHPETLHTMTLVGSELRLLHRCRDARPVFGEALAGLEKTQPDHMYVGEALDELAGCDAAEGRPADAVARLERAITIEAKVSGASADRGSYRWHLARALWSLGRRDAAIAAARQAAQELASDPDHADEHAEAQAWLARR
jgi:tetratricopeptide (TPR) repeat protein/predicted Ser/Thr protein kinase